MKKLFTIILSVILILLCASCGGEKQETKAPKVQIDSPLAGVWKYYKDIPSMPNIKEWTIEFKNDGTYNSKGEDIPWGSGKYAVTGNKFVLNRDSKYKASKQTEQYFDIVEQNGQKQLIFKDDNGETSIQSIIGTDKYYVIFIRQ